jgi:hypothetical protein
VKVPAPPVPVKLVIPSMWASWAEAAVGGATTAALTAARASNIIFLLMLDLSRFPTRTWSL